MTFMQFFLEEELHNSVCVQEEYFRDFSLHFFSKGFEKDFYVWKVHHWAVHVHVRANIHNAHFFTEYISMFFVALSL